MNIPHSAPRPRRYRCQCGTIGKVPPGAFNVLCKQCGRTFGPPDRPVNQTREMERNRRRMEKK